MLDSHDFGIVAAALIVTILLHNIRDVGLGQALIQRKDLDAGHVATAFAISFYLGIAIAVSLVLAAPIIATDLTGVPASVNVLRALGVIFALRGLATVSFVLCQRAMNFRTIALVDTSSYAAGSLVSITAALLGAGPWALVAGYLVEEALSATLYVMIRPPILSLRIDRSRSRDLLHFGAGQTIIQIAGILATYGDNFVVGRNLGATALGFYSRAYDLIKLPAAVFSNVIGNVLFPAFSRLQDDRAQLASGFRRVIFANALVLLPGSAVLIILAPEVIRILMGANWDEAVTPFRILAVTILMRTSYKVGAMVAASAGNVYGAAIANVVYMIAVIAGAMLTIREGIAGVAVSTAVALCIVYVHCSYLALRVSGLSARALVSAHVPGLALAVVVTAVTWPVTTVLRGELPTAITFVVVLALALAVAVAGLAVALRVKLEDGAWLRAELGRIRSKLRRRT
ncbi:MAG: lipopolysaccharide biosynthesis protein [Deltaproteobacteria bacterium]|nr:lipopolysaccharide biosynthesis protein [Deltaproteobacteria bacterium]